MRDKPQETCQSEQPTHSYDSVSIIVVGNKEEDYTHKHEKCVNVVPAFGKEVLGADSNNSDDQFSEEDPYKNIIEDLYKPSVRKHKEDGVDKR
jgi:hypothetical protein